jgi:hypothetical protein
MGLTYATLCNYRPRRWSVRDHPGKPLRRRPDRAAVRGPRVLDVRRVRSQPVATGHEGDHFHRDHRGPRAHLLATCRRSAGTVKGRRRRRAQRACPRRHRRPLASCARAQAREGESTVDERGTRRVPHPSVSGRRRGTARPQVARPQWWDASAAPASVGSRATRLPCKRTYLARSARASKRPTR